VRLISRLRDEDGNVLAISMMMVSLMLVLGSASLSTVDTQTDVVKKERQHESTFNLAEGVLNAQTFVLGRLGTGSASTAGQFPAKCSETTSHILCPAPAQVARSYASATQNDYDASTTWRTWVRDNPNGAFYNPINFENEPRYDQNGDNQLWVRAEATVRDRTRTIVALISVEDVPINFPNYAIAGGWFATTNNGRKVIVDATGSLGVGVRCSNPPPSDNCLDYEPNKGQLSPPDGWETDYTKENAIRSDDLQAIIDFSKANGSYYASCPSNPNGDIVVVEAGDCSYNNSTPAAVGASKCCNTASNPGLLIVMCGSVSFGGNIEFHGIVYVPNRMSPTSETYCRTGPVVTTQGTSLITGGVLIDGPGGLLSGSSGMNVKFNPNAFAGISTAGTAGVVQNTWREVPDEN
jgi:hypothetical protein